MMQVKNDHRQAHRRRAQTHRQGQIYDWKCSFRKWLRQTCSYGIQDKHAHTCRPVARGSWHLTAVKYPYILTWEKNFEQGMQRTAVCRETDWPRIGTSSEVRGTVLASMRRKTVKASSTEMPALIFSPGGQRTHVNTTWCTYMYMMIAFCESWTILFIFLVSITLRIC